MFCICKENNKADSILPDIVRNIISRCILFSNQPNSLIMFIEKENIFTSNNFVCRLVRVKIASAVGYNAKKNISAVA